MARRRRKPCSQTTVSPGRIICGAMSGRSLPDRIRRLLGAHLDPPEAARDRGPRALPKRGDDPDQVDEARAILDSLGGAVWAGDVVELESSDPSFWNARSFEQSYRIECVCRAEMSDPTGNYTFSIFFLAPDQGADVLILEGDLPMTARAYLGVRGPDVLVNELRRHREDYMQSPRAEVTYTVEPDGLGEWTAYSAREQGRFWVLHGTSNMVPHSAYGIDGVAYRDCAFYYGDSDGATAATWVLTLMELAGFGHAFQAEAIPLARVKFWRRDRT